jgi:hypothetical protein
LRQKIFQHCVIFQFVQRRILIESAQNPYQFRNIGLSRPNGLESE